MKLEVQPFELRTRHPFRISRGVQTTLEVFIFRLEYEGLVGWGESSPPNYYGEDSATVDTAIKRVAGKLDGDPETLRTRLASGDLRELLAEDASVRAALDVALWDISGKAQDKPIYELLGLDAAKTPATSFSIGIDTPQVVDAKVDEASAFRILKMKMGLPGDLALLDRVIARSGKTVRVDANEGWDVETALQMSSELNDKGVEFIEQPIHHDREDDLRTLKRLSPLPIILDESIINPKDVAKRRDQGHGINIKLMKCGGITPALSLIEEASRADLKVMLGCMLETSIAITAAAHLSPLVDYADLDGNLLIANDPYSGVTVANGKLVLPDRPGLGVVKRGDSL
ncbi:MAG: dipeptide epimerase [Candidatus Krumholzibacteria bacterium]|nr:dipeptide epimerase [Candidatus Krumholzibacteria bacterium]